ncbi:hypothetical protein G6O67_004121 [Ophiocordyceps sinensis]|uniref:Uncharacterized protein n=1 Tax=Ophiocordyceps sinensis TaxID=72228 RepID=A0A8H4LY34_9HYPO|nr:hypothetical protein G6O67_004121 [Ophiocordyceps sinensis]
MHLGVFFPAFLAVHVSSQEINVLVSDYAQRTRDQVLRDYTIDWRNPPKTKVLDVQSHHCHPVGGGLVGNPEITVYVKTHNETSQNNWGRTTASLSLSTWTTVTDMVSEGWTVGGTLSPSKHLSVSSSYSKHYTSGTSVTEIESQDVPCPSLNQCTVQTWTYHVKISGKCERIPFMKHLWMWWSWDPCDMKVRRLCRPARDFIKETCLVHEIPDPHDEDSFAASHKFEPCQFQFPISDQTGKPFTETHLFTESLGERPRAYEKHPDGWCWLDSGDLYRDDFDLYWDNEKTAWVRKPWAVKPDMTGFEPCRKNKVPEEVPKIAGKDEHGYCYLNESHYYSTAGKYWTEKRGWYFDSDAPKPDTSGFEPCPGDKTTGSGGKARLAVPGDETPKTGSSEVPKVMGKDRGGYCYLNSTHYYAGGGGYWTKSRGWYRDPEAPKPDTQGFKSCVPRRLGRPRKTKHRERPSGGRNGTQDVELAVTG